ncbi:permease [Cloacibacillus sp. An23]|uniref:permease n=1 Tax=Cloacibacillus sp. An23 TaxID=1965591 RepID=UPI000B38C000|nr:permease [Cloacibacillus sp. An23]OUO92797.1 hypothetical protein B5F39_09995 [Cloacibacillus sp. An23]
MEKELVYFCRHFWMVLRDIAPFWALGIAAGSFVSVFAKERINALFARISDGPLAIFAASALGIASPLCMYGTAPLAASFSGKGMDDGVLASFMMSSVLLNPQLMIYTAALGMETLAARTVSVFVCGAAAGFLVKRCFGGRGFFNFKGFGSAENRDTDPNMTMRLLKNIGRNIRATGPSFLAGVALTAALIRLIPSRAIAGAFGESGFGVAAAAVAGVPLYFCGGGTIPLLAEWMSRGMGLGPAVAFMLTGPATKLTNLGALKTVLGAAHFALYIAFSMIFALAAGYAAAFLI